MFQAVALAAWMLALPLVVESAVPTVPAVPALLDATRAPEPELDISTKHCEQVEGTVFCKALSGGHIRLNCFFSYCDAVAAGYTQCRHRKAGEICGEPL